MELREGPPRGAGPRCPDGSGGGAADRISGLPDDLLLHVLARLRCARASLLSRRWRGLWGHLPELTFREITPGALDAALAQVARTELSLLDIDVPERHRFSSPAGITSLLRAAARLAPAELRFVVWGHDKDRSIAVEVPRFRRATSIKLAVWNLFLNLPDHHDGGGCGFPAVERLCVQGCSFNFGALMSQCPRLRLLELKTINGIGTIKVDSPIIESIDVGGVGLRGIDIVAPLLKKFTLDGNYTRRDLSVVSFSAPMVENVRWSAYFFPWWVLIGGMWRLRSFGLHLEESAYLLNLLIEAEDYWLAEGVNYLKQYIVQFPYFSFLQLSLVTWGHIYGSTLLKVLEVCTDIKRLKLDIYELKCRKPCTQNCPCDQAYNWRSQNISLAALEEVEINGFQGAGHEVDLLKLILRCSPMLKIITVTLSDKVSLCSSSGCKQIYRVLKASPSLKWSFYSQPW
ncbi:unnamed protein product [Urochloa humidicola]